MQENHKVSGRKHTFMLIFINILLLLLLCLSIYLIIGILHTTTGKRVHTSHIIQKGGDR